MNPTHGTKGVTKPMLTVECPWCAAPLTVDDDRADLKCDACAIRVEFAPNPPIALAAAA